MIQLIYASAAAVPFTQPELEALLYKARAKNTRLGVSGLLIYHRGSFLQVLEGAETAVRGLYETIARDPRHAKLMLVRDKPVTAPTFAGWSMGFVDTARTAATLPGFFDYLTGIDGGNWRADEDMALWAVSEFRRGRLRQLVGGVSHPSGVVAAPSGRTVATAH